jgi:DNA mismatch endonuclease, patch repair protein
VAGRVSKLRSRIMAAVKSKNTSPEKLMRKQLTRLGLRYRLNRRNLPGCPDIVFPRSKLAIFCDGDFWHGRFWKKRMESGEFKVRRKFWINKIECNIRRDRKVNKELRAIGWRVVRIWETDIKKNGGKLAERIQSILENLDSPPPGRPI